MQPIYNLMKPTVAQYTKTMKGRVLITNHIKFLRESPNSRTVQVHPNDARRFNYCLNAYLHSMSFDVNIHWAVMLINDLNSPEDFNIHTTSLIIPSVHEIETILTTADLQ